MKKLLIPLSLITILLVGQSVNAQEKSVEKVIGKRVKMSINVDDLEEDERVIIIKSADGEEEIRIKGDAVITITDGNLKVERSSGNLKEVKEEKEVKEVKKVKKN